MAGAFDDFKGETIVTQVAAGGMNFFDDTEKPASSAMRVNSSALTVSATDLRR